VFVPIPATYVVGQDGRILARHVDPDFRSRMDIEDIIAALPPAQVLRTGSSSNLVP